MPKIVTITYSPCIDKSTSVPSIFPDKKLRCSLPKLEPGGGGINVARAIKKIGGEAIAIFPSGGYTGKYFNYLLEKENISSVIIETSSETRENIIVLDESTNNQYRFGMPGTSLSENEWKQSLCAVEKINDTEFIIASGSLPPGVPLDIYARLAKIARNNNSKFIVDTSGEALKQAVDEGVYLLKPSIGELCALVDKKHLLQAEVKEVASGIIAKGKCEVIVVSMGEQGAMLVTGEVAEIISPPAVIKKSTVGAGDSMLGGIVFFLSEGKSLLEAVQYGVACGTAATMNAGTELCRKVDADRLFSLINGRGRLPAMR
jgi:6-phosphofructokinase 2